MLKYKKGDPVMGVLMNIAFWGWVAIGYIFALAFIGFPLTVGYVEIFTWVMDAGAK